MRIVSGRAGGIPIQVPRSLLRPTADRTREAVFSMLGDAPDGARVLDLFAGSGSFGLESLSRGAASCVFVDSERASAAAIEATLRKAGLSGGTTVTARAETWIRRAAPASFDLIFADPPYAKRAGDDDFAARLLASPELRAALAADGTFVLESFAGRTPAPPAADGWTVAADRRYGETRILLLRPQAASDS